MATSSFRIVRLTPYFRGAEDCRKFILVSEPVTHHLRLKMEDHFWKGCLIFDRMTRTSHDIKKILFYGLEIVLLDQTAICIKKLFVIGVCIGSKGSL